jgi:sn-glycerol 3-phosphate transport system permease protein
VIDFWPYALSRLMEKRVTFKSTWLPWALIAPQMAIILVFFFWPAGQALYQSVLQEDAFGTTREFVGLDNFRRLFSDPSYLASFRRPRPCSRPWWP